MPVMTRSNVHAWWSDLRHSGLVVAPALLEEYFPDGPVVPKWYSYQRLRERYAVFETWCQHERAYEQGADTRPLYTWLDNVLDIFLGHEGSRWQKGSNVAATWKYDTLLRERLAPHRVLFRDTTQREPALFVWIEQTRQLGQGHGRMAYGKLLELLRAKNVKLGLLTNGRQFRLCYAGLDYDSWVEWDVESWFAEEELRRQLHGFYTLLGAAGMNPRGTSTSSFPLLEAAEASRTRQGELSLVLGEQVREAVEMLLNEVNAAVRENPALLDIVRMTPRGTTLSEKRVLEALYQATVRIIMRLVIILFAEARDMLPRSLALYANSYGLEGLYEQLRRAAQYEGRNALEEQHSAWIRLLSLFSMLYHGSASSVLPVHAYGGMLFRPGQGDSTDATLRATTLFESVDILISDATVLRLLERLKNGRVKIRQGRSGRWVNGPVDFSELRTEYIGLMYQGLLDFNVHATDQPMIFLNLGQEPVLPLALLEGMSDQHLKDLLKKLSIEKSSGPAASEGEEGEADEVISSEESELVVADGAEVEELEPLEVEEAEDAEEEQEEATTLTEADLRQKRALAWAERAVEAAGLLKMKKPKAQQTDALYLYEKERTRRARTLIKRVLDQDEFYLVRRGGTRKGSGTFYTRPQLAVPIARRTLEPLLYTSLEDGTRVPKKPEEILAVKVCDPACGSASFLVAALHYITDALYQSLVYYQRINDQREEGSSLIAVTLPLGGPSRARPEEELLPVRPNSERFEVMTKARLRRYVVERCIYGVDLSPLAVELARMSLWIETLDRDLPFTFLDHKIKVGNALVGAWFDTFREYPIMAWMRDGGDASHNNGVRYKAKEWTNAINKARNEVIKPELIVQIESSTPQLFEEYVQQTPEDLHKTITAEMEQIHAMPVGSAQEREERYRAMQQQTEYQEVKRAFDRWCAAWFWPADEVEQAPTPANFYQPARSTQDIVDELADELHFFHWEIEFPDVFARPEHGFDAVLANPPWDIAKSNSHEFFSDYDPLYRTYGKQEALSEQQKLFQLDTSIEREWLLNQTHFKGMSNWVKASSSPFGDSFLENKRSFVFRLGSKNEQLHTEWRRRRSRYHTFVDPKHPFNYQDSTGSGLSTYKLFLEIAHHLLKQRGHLGMLVPSSIYTDRGATALRSLFINNCRWDSLFGFINWRHIFDIHSNFKFVAMILEKGQNTQYLKVAFNHVELSDLEQAENAMLKFPRKLLEQFSPVSLALVELQTQFDLDILAKIYTSDNTLLNDHSERSWRLHSTVEEFHMTKDSALFQPISKWRSEDSRCDDYGRWLGSNGDISLPLYEGRMVGAFDPSEKGWVGGKGRSAVWRSISFENKNFEPQYLVSLDTYNAQEKALKGNKIGFMEIGSSTNVRSMYATFISNMPCGNTVSVLQTPISDIVSILTLVACLNAFTYDYVLRCRLGGLHLSSFVLAETPLIPPARLLPTPCAQLAACLNLIMPSFAPQWLEMRAAYPHFGTQHWRGLWAITTHERLRLRCILDAIIAELYGLEYDDFAWILRDDTSNPKGFWRVDKEKPRELRHTTLALAAFKRLKEVGLEAFCDEDWQFPEEIGAQLGPRFTAWQEEGTVEESWAECEEHARRMKETPIPLPDEDGAERTSSNGGNGSNGRKNGRRKVGKVSEGPEQEGQLGLWTDAGL